MITTNTFTNSHKNKIEEMNINNDLRIDHDDHKGHEPNIAMIRSKPRDYYYSKLKHLGQKYNYWITCHNHWIKC